MDVHENSDPQAPRIHRPADELSRLEMLIHVSDLSILPYKRKLEAGISLTIDEERMMNVHINTLRKLEMDKQALEARMQMKKKSNTELARYMLEKGMHKEQILTFFQHSREVQLALDEAENDV
jgi:hypothetical protein